VLLVSSPAICHEQTVTTSDFADVSIQSCKQHPASALRPMALRDRKRDGRGASGGKQLSPDAFYPLTQSNEGYFEVINAP